MDIRHLANRAASNAAAVTLDASLSFDPDVSDGPDSGLGAALSSLSFLWVCTPVASCPTLPNGGSVAVGGLPALSIPAALFVGSAADTVCAMSPKHETFSFRDQKHLQVFSASIGFLMFDFL